LDLAWTWKYFTINLRKCFQYLFLKSHHEFLLPSKFPFISPLIFPFVLLGLIWSLISWKKDLPFFFLALFFCGFIPQVVFVIFQDKAAPRHLMLLIPSLSFFAAAPFSLFAFTPRNKAPSTAILAVFLAIFFLTASYITFLSPHWDYKVCRMRREMAEFVRDRLNSYFFYVIRAGGPLYLQNRVVDFITYPEVSSLHYHLPSDYPQPGTTGDGVTQKYRYLNPRKLPTVLHQPITTKQKTGFVFEDSSLIPLFESAFGPGCVERKCAECAPWVFYSVLYREVK